jgi:hypothetical protein
MENLSIVSLSSPCLPDHLYEYISDFDKICLAGFASLLEKEI